MATFDPPNSLPLYSSPTNLISGFSIFIIFSRSSSWLNGIIISATCKESNLNHRSNRVSYGGNLDSGRLTVGSLKIPTIRKSQLSRHSFNIKECPAWSRSKVEHVNPTFNPESLASFILSNSLNIICICFRPFNSDIRNFTLKSLHRLGTLHNLRNILGELFNHIVGLFVKHF